MKKLLISLVLIAVVVVLLHLALFVFINFKGRDIIIAKLQKNFGQEAQLDSLSLSFPFAIEIQNFQCADISFRRAKASLGLSNPFTSLLISNLSLEDLTLKVTMDRKGARAEPLFAKPWGRRRKPEVPDKASEGFALPDQISVSESKNATKEKLQPAKKFPIIIKNLYLKGGRIQLNEAIRGKPVITTISNINAHLRNFSYPDLTKFSLDLSGALKTQEGISKKNIDINGWVDYSRKDMNLALKLKKIDYAAFSEYYPLNWKPENLGIGEAFLSLNSDFISQGNELTIKNALTVDSVDYLELEEGQEESSRIKTLKTVLAFLKGSRDKPTFNFIIKTKMDSPKLDFSSIKKSFKETIPFSPALILQGVAGVVKEEVEEKLKDTKEITVDEAVDIFKETGEQILDTLKDILIPRLDEAIQGQSPESQDQEHPNPIVVP